VKADLSDEDGDAEISFVRYWSPISHDTQALGDPECMPA
jgi:hypothetical protein